MSANERQVGGSHYGDSYFKHWDWVLSIGMQYLEGNATRYLARCGKKQLPGKTLEESAVDDLQKAHHYVEKVLENARVCQAYALKCAPEMEDWIEKETERFIETNEITDVLICDTLHMLAGWNTPDELVEAMGYIDRLIVQYQVSEVPLEDSNKHALFEDDEE